MDQCAASGSPFKENLLDLCLFSSLECGIKHL